MSLFNNTFWKPPRGVEAAIKRGDSKFREAMKRFAPRAEPMRARMISDDVIHRRSPAEEVFR